MPELLPNVTLTPSPLPLTAFKLLSFDVYGTLVDWQQGIRTAFTSSVPFQHLPSDHPLKQDGGDGALWLYSRYERQLQTEEPGLEYSELLGRGYTQIIRNDSGLKIPGDISEDELASAAKSFSRSVKDWPLFPDTLQALKALQKHYKLVPLTNSSPSTFGASVKYLFGPGDFAFDAAYLASDIGSYKPSPRNFEYLLEHAKKDFGLEDPKREILHVAQSLHHDHIPAEKFGLCRVWVDRNDLAGGGKSVFGGLEEGEKASVNWRVGSLGELAGMVESAFAEEGKEK